MARVVIPYRPVSGGPEIVEQLVANDDALSGTINGGLEADSNVSVGPPSAALTGAANAEGNSSTLLRSDAQFIIRGFEQLPSEPTSDHFLGRVYFDTSDNQLKRCTNPSTGAYTPFDNLGVAQVATHGSSHSQGSTDPLANGAISSAMMGRSVATKSLASDVSNLAKLGYTTVLTCDPFTTATSQVVTLSGRLLINNAGGLGADARVFWQVIDTTNSNALVVSNSGNFVATGTTGSVVLGGIVLVTAGTRTFRLQAGFQSASGTTGLDALASHTPFVGATFTTYLSVVVG